MNPLSQFPIDDLKLIYRVLHQHLTEHLELMDSQLFETLQSWLHARAGAEGVDINDHQKWDEWLRAAHTPCEQRVAQRRTLHLVRDDE